MTEEAKPGVYGYVLILRLIAAAAIGCESAAALRVLCILAEYADKNGTCYVGQGTIAKRLAIRRQAVNRSINFLVGNDWIATTSRPGRTMVYQLNLSFLDERMDYPDIGTQRWLHAKERDAKVQHDCVAPVQPPDVAGGAT